MLAFCLVFEMFKHCSSEILHNVPKLLTKVQQSSSSVGLIDNSYVDQFPSFRLPMCLDSVSELEFNDFFLTIFFSINVFLNPVSLKGLFSEANLQILVSLDTSVGGLTFVFLLLLST